MGLHRESVGEYFIIMTCADPPAVLPLLATDDNEGGDVDEDARDASQQDHVAQDDQHIYEKACSTSYQPKADGAYTRLC